VAPSVKAEDSDLIYLGEGGAVTITAENQNKILGLKGNKNAMVEFEVSAELKVIDTSFMLANGGLDLTGDNAGVLTVVNAENVYGTVASVSQYGDYRYLAVSNAGTYSFHPFNMAISRRGINVVSKTVSLEAMFIANNVVREMITDFGVYKLDDEKAGAYSAQKAFDKKNGVVAGYDLANSLDAEMLNETRNFCAYIMIGDVLIQGNQKVEVTPATVLADVNKAYADGKYSGEEKALTVKAKNYMPLEDSKDGDGNTGFCVILRVTMDNGNIYAFRVYNDKGTYALQSYGYASSITGWGVWKNIHHLADDFNGDGVDFKMERAGNQLILSAGGNVVCTYTMDGVTADNKVSSFAVIHTGNKGAYVEVPFALTPVEQFPNLKGLQCRPSFGRMLPQKQSYFAQHKKGKTG
jgi:hypothetical protein